MNDNSPNQPPKAIPNPPEEESQEVDVNQSERGKRAFREEREAKKIKDPVARYEALQAIYARKALESVKREQWYRRRLANHERKGRKTILPALELQKRQIEARNDYLFEIPSDPQKALLEQCHDNIGLFISFFLPHLASKPFSKLHEEIFSDLYWLATGRVSASGGRPEGPGIAAYEASPDELGPLDAQTPLSSDSPGLRPSLAQDAQGHVTPHPGTELSHAQAQVSHTLSHGILSLSHGEPSGTPCHTPYTGDSSPHDPSYTSNTSYPPPTTHSVNVKAATPGGGEGGGVALDAASSDNLVPPNFSQQFQPIDAVSQDIPKGQRKRKLVIAAPRGSAKSTLVGEGFVLWCICFKVVDFVILFSDTEDQAKARLEVVRGELEGNERLRQVFGDLVSKKVWGSLEIECANKVKVLVRGAGQKIRGLKYRNARPQLVVVDDVENDESVETEEQRRKLKRWFRSAVLPGMDPSGFIALIGTLLHEDSLLADLMKSSQWVRRKYAILDENNKSLWPEMYSTEEIFALRDEYASHGDLDLFYREYMNEILAPEDAIFKRENFRTYDEKTLLERVEAGEAIRTYGCVDPAYKTQNKNDFTAFVICSVDSKNHMYVREIFRQRVDLPNLIDALFLLTRKWKPFMWGIQSVDWDRMLRYPLQEEMRRRNKFPHIQTLATYAKEKGMTSKKARIERLSPRYAAGQIFHVKECRGLEHLEAELLSFPRSRFDDVMDCLSMMIDLVWPTQERRVSRYPAFMKEQGTDPTSGYG